MALSALQPAITPVTEKALRAASFVLAFLVMSYFHVVIGEVVPKNLAIDRADRLAAIVAPALLIFSRISEPFVWVIEKSSAAITHTNVSMEFSRFQCPYGTSLWIRHIAVLKGIIGSKPR